MLGFLKGFFGTKSDKDVKSILPVVEEINREFAALHDITNDELRAYTQQFKQQIQDAVAPLTAEIAEMKEKAESDEISVLEKEDLYREIDKLEKEHDAQIETVLLEILPKAFAVVRETARRFKENETIEVTATPLDRDFAAVKDFVSIQGEKAIYKNSWTAAGGQVKWNMVHYDVQLIGGYVLHTGKISEMATGEGKTLVSTLPSYLNALAGKGVHIVTVNDYLARRDSEWNGPIFQFLGLTVDCIDKYQPHSPERRKAYNCDITYGTNNEFGFDYLRDNMSRSPEDLVQRKLHYAMVDEVDSVLIDDARTPLIISGPVPKGEDQEFLNLKPRILRVVEAQKKIVNQYLNDARKLIESGNTGTGEGEGGFNLLRAHRGLPKYGNLIRYMSESGIAAIKQKTENRYLADQQKDMPKVDAGLYFTIDEKQNQVDLTEKGIDLITESGEDAKFFLLPDMGSEIAEIEKLNISTEEKIARKDELMADFAIKSERVHSIQQLLKAYALFDIDVDYVVMDGKVKIVDEQTGRILEGRRYSDGLHQAIEAKENVKVEAATQTHATVTLQNYFRMYHKLAGMTGTAETEAGEFWTIYKLDVVVIPTNVPAIRKDVHDFVYKTKKEKYKAVIDEIEKLSKAGRPVLVGTTSVEVSELISRMLKLRGIKHNVLNAKQHQREAEVVAEAGFAGTVTIATNMAGRGTDIKLGPGVKEAGGLAIVGTERHEARRVDRQLRGRAGRQGDPGTSQFLVSLEDDLMRLFGSERIARMMDRLGHKEGDVIQAGMITSSIERAQKKVEENNFGTRKRLLEYDDVMNSQRTVIYARRHHALFGERLAIDINNMVSDLCDELVNLHYTGSSFAEFSMDVIRFFSTQPPFTEQEFAEGKPEDLAQQLFEAVQAFYARKSEHFIQQTWPFVKDVYDTRRDSVENIVFPMTDGKKGIQLFANLQKAYETKGRELVRSFEKSITLAIIDDAWREHLRQMDELKTSVQNAVYEQKDPLLIYKFEAFELFKKMIGEVNREVCSFLFKGNLPKQEPEQQVRTQGSQQRTDFSKMKSGRDGAAGAIASGQQVRQQQREGIPEQEQHRPMEPVRVGPKVGRNDPCPCGSGKKYKNCHGRENG